MLSSTFSAALAPAAVELSVSNLPRSVAFYREVLGMTLRSSSEQRAELGTAGRRLVVLHALAQPEPAQRSTGLYHLALLLPTRADLGRFLGHVAELGLRIGASDHLVSEAVYLSDPDGHGIEVYRDRPRAEWPRVGGQVQMASDPLDAPGLLGSAGDRVWSGLPAETVMGHLHFKVADQQAASEFYRWLGFEPVAELPGASFLSVGGYHHHLGLNVWDSRGALPPPANTPALLEAHFTLSAADLSALEQRLAAGGLPAQSEKGAVSLSDPSGIRLRFSVA